MRKREFLRELRTRLNRTNCEDTEDVIAYYNELIEDTIDRTGQTEEEVIEDLGSITDIILRVNPPENRKKEATNKIYYDEYEDTQKRISNSNIKRENRDTKVAGIILTILTAPLWFSLLIMLFSLIISVVAAGISIGVGGVYSIVYGAIHFGNGFANALFEIGIGITLIGATFILFPLIVKLIILIVKLIINFIKWLVGATKNNGRRVRYEN